MRGNIVLVLQQDAERIGDHRRIERDRVEFDQRGGPIEGFGDAGRLEQILPAQRLHHVHDFGRQPRANPRHLGAHDRKLAAHQYPLSGKPDIELTSPE
jgi:hypothetical protein